MTEKKVAGNVSALAKMKMKMKVEANRMAIWMEKTAFNQNDF